MEPPTVPPIAAFNVCDPQVLEHKLLGLTASPLWARGLVSGRPYADATTLRERSSVLIHGLPQAEIDLALAGHPRIGEHASNLPLPAQRRSAREQAGVQDATPDVRTDLAKANADYEAIFGRIYLVYASGKSAPEMLQLCRQRQSNDPLTELDVVRGELAKITAHRLTALTFS